MRWPARGDEMDLVEMKTAFSCASHGRDGRCESGRTCRQKVRCGVRVHPPALLMHPGVRRGPAEGLRSTILRFRSCRMMRVCIGFVLVGFRGRGVGIVLLLQQRFDRRETIECVRHRSDQLRDTFTGSGRDGMKFQPALRAEFAKFFETRTVSSRVQFCADNDPPLASPRVFR